VRFTDERTPKGLGLVCDRVAAATCDRRRSLLADRKRLAYSRHRRGGGRGYFCRRRKCSQIDLNPGPIATYFQHLAQENTAKSRAILVKADQVADSLGLDDTLLDSLLVKLGLE
jgi:hypothetical protein